jgi:DMSO/TMAO reductase YedYZ molybdopterin-dependent catalytic subunit
MRRSWWTLGAVLGALTSLAAVGVFRLGFRVAGLPDLPYDLFDWLARILPGRLITAGIDAMVSLITFLRIGPTSAVAKFAEQVMAMAMFVLGGSVMGAAVGGMRSRLGAVERRAMAVRGGLFAVLLAGAAVAIEGWLGFPPVGVVPSILWLAAVILAWGATLGWLVGTPRTAGAEAPIPEGGVSRRSFLAVVGGGSLAALLAGLGLDALLRPRREPAPAGALAMGGTSGAAASPAEEVLAARIEPAPGTRPELTANEDFYRIDINTVPPHVDASTWRLEIAGLVYTPLSLTLDEIRARPALSQVVTMQCISNRVGGDLTSTSLWTGVPLRDLLDEAGLGPGALEVAIESADGFYESVARDDILDERTLLVYQMNGEPLPPEHGFPLRIYIPNRYGMKQPKWITRMEVIGDEGPGYWVDRGWDAEAIARTTSVIDPTPRDLALDESGVLPLGGIAWAGSRGIDKIEVSVDGGEWVEAQLRNPPLSPLTWVQWRYDWPSSPGRHVVRVRAVDGTGMLQTDEVNDPHPSGATGYHERTIVI